ncbi:MAG: hypothetical protein ACTSO7_02760 [Candidatus Heimdallarchaeota archaeon]
MQFESPLAPYDAIKKAKKYFEEDVLNTTIKEAPLTRGDDQILEVGISGGRWEVFWMKIHAVKSETGSRVYLKGRPGISQLTMGSIAVLVSVPFAFLALMNDNYWLLFIPVFFLILGVLSIIMPIVRIRNTRKEVIEKLTEEKKEKKRKQK